MITIKEFYGDVKDIDESVLAVKSDCLWEKGSLLDIKNLVTPQLFYLHILVNLIGNWKYEGWWFIMCEMVQFVPYIAETLSQAGAEDMKTAFEKVIDCFPGDTRFENSEEYFDIVNFLQSMAYKVKNESLKTITREERKANIKKLQKCVDKLDEITSRYWGDDAPGHGWKQAIDYIELSC